MCDWWEDHRGKVIAAVVTFHAGVAVGFVVASRLGRLKEGR